jgi:hypothetical protein
MQKLRAITDQLNADFRGVRPTVPAISHHRLFGGLKRSDCIAFLANGDFQSTGQYVGRTVVGNVASIFYGLADPPAAKPKDKILVRRQTILTYDSSVRIIDPLNLDEEYYTKSLAEWRVLPPDPNYWTMNPAMDPNDSKDLVMYMARGVDDFTIQYVRWEPALMNYRWFPINNDITPGTQQLQRISARNAIKFTFTLYDSKGVIRNGRKFTHIVYCGD